MLGKRKERLKKYQEASELYITASSSLLKFDQNLSSLSLLKAMTNMLQKIKNEQ